MAESKQHVEAKSLVPYVNGVPGFTSGWQGENDDAGIVFGDAEDFGEFHAAYIIWGGRVWLQGTIRWAAPFEPDPVYALLGVLPQEIRPATTVEMGLLEDWPNSSAGIFGVGGSGNTTAQVTPDGTWTLTGFLAPQEQNPAYVLDGISWPLPGLALQNPEAAPRFDMADILPPANYVPGPNGAFLVQGGGRIRGEGSVICVGAGASFLGSLPYEWRPKVRVPVPGDPPEFVNDGTTHTRQELFPFNGLNFLQNERKCVMPTLAGGQEPIYLSHVNRKNFGDFGEWLMDNSPYFVSPTNGFPTAGTELSLEQVSWIGGDEGGGAILTPGAAEAAEALGGAVRNAVRAVGRIF